MRISSITPLGGRNLRNKVITFLESEESCPRPTGDTKFDLERRYFWLQRITVKRGTFDRYDFSESSIKGRLSFCSFHGAKFDGCKFSGHFEFCFFVGATAVGAKFSAELNGPDFKEADLREADFSRADFGRHGVGLFDGAKIDSVNFRGVRLQNGHFNRTSGSTVCFAEASMGNSEFRRAFLPSANFQDAQLAHANFQKAKLTSANFRSAGLVSADLRGANLTEADLSGADLRLAELDGARLSGASLRDADLSLVPFEVLDSLRDVNLDGAKIGTAEYRRWWDMPDDERKRAFPDGPPQQAVEPDPEESDVLWTMPDGYWTWDDSNQLVQSDRYPLQWWPQWNLEIEPKVGQKFWGVIVHITKSHAYVNIGWWVEVILPTTSMSESLRSRIQGLEIVEVVVTRIEGPKGPCWGDLVDGT